MLPPTARPNTPQCTVGEGWRQPGERTLVALRQRNFTKLRLDNLLRSYLVDREFARRSDGDFHRYCLESAKAAEAVRDRRALKEGWAPSDSTVDWLCAAGLTPALILRLAERFSGSSASVGLAGSIDLTFRDYAQREFERMKATGLVVERGVINRWESEWQWTPLPRGWIPRRATVDQLLREGVPMDFIDYLLPTFRLYWNEVGEARGDWDKTFASHIRYRWREQREKL